MAKITTAWVWVYPHSSQYKEMKFDDIKQFCKQNGYVISKNGQLFDIDGYTFSADVQPLRQYCFTVGYYECPPHIDLVPKGTTIVDGRYVFPKMVKTIKIWDTIENCTKYLYRLRPTRFTADKTLCLKLDDAEAKRASEWLTFIGINHEVIEVEGNH